MSKIRVSLRLLEQVIEIMECNDPGQQVINRLRAAVDAAQPSAEPVATINEAGFSLEDARRVMALTPGTKLYAQPTDSAALRDAAIAELVRRKMTSGNGVPVERCIITAAEVAAIAQQEAP